MGKTNYVYSARRVKRNAFLLPDGQKKQISLYHQIGKTKGVFSVRRVKQNVFIPPNGNKTKCVSNTRWAKRKVFFLSHGSNKVHFFRQTGKMKCISSARRVKRNAVFCLRNRRVSVSSRTS